MPEVRPSGSGTRYSTLPSSSDVPPSGWRTKSELLSFGELGSQKRTALERRRAFAAVDAVDVVSSSVESSIVSIARTELALGVAAHRVRSAGVEALARVQDAAVEAGRERAHPAHAQVRTNTRSACRSCGRRPRRRRRRGCIGSRRA